MAAAVRQDLRYAVRSLSKQPGFTAIAVLMLGLGIGATVAIMSLAYAVLVKPLPYADPDRLMLVHLLKSDRDAPGVLGTVIWSYPKYGAFRDQQKVFESTAVFGPGNWNLTGSGSPERLIGEVVESSYFPLLGLTARTGRVLSEEETRAPGSVPLAVIGHGFWLRRFGGDPAVLGRTIGLNGVPHTVIGILPPGFRGLTGQADVFVPITTLSADELGEPWNHSYYVVGRRRSDASSESARAAVALLGSEVDARFPDRGWARGCSRSLRRWRSSSRPWASTA